MKQMKLVFVLLLSFTAQWSFAQWYYNGSSIMYTYDKIGIGTYSPHNPLEVKGQDGIRLTGNSHPNDAFMLLQPDVDVSSLNPGGTTHSARITGRRLGHLVIDIEANDSRDAFAIRTDKNFDGTVDNIAMVVQPSGNVGVGTTDPAQKLDVAGNVRVRGSGGVARIMNGDSNEYLQFDANDESINLASDGSTKLRIVKNGNTGIGTTDPAQKLDVAGNIRVRGSNGIAKVMNGDSNEFIQFDANDESISFFSNDNEALRILNGGMVAIGTSSAPSGYKLAVDGKIICEELRVKLSQNWPDYVFAEDYELMSLEEVEQSIKENGHLPGIPSAAEVEKEGGIEVGEMQRLMLEKMEEMTLHLIELKKENEQLRKELQELKNQ